jgi:acyl-CoA thioester hydrolase
MAEVFTVRVQLRFGDFDANRHINNVAYFAVMETARIRFLLELRAKRRLARTLIVHADIDYLRSIGVETPHVDVDMSVLRIGTSSVTLLHEIRDEHGVAARGHAVVVGVDEKGSTRPFSEDEVESLALYGSVTASEPADVH